MRTTRCAALLTLFFLLCGCPESSPGPDPNAGYNSSIPNGSTNGDPNLDRCINGCPNLGTNNNTNNDNNTGLQDVVVAIHRVEWGLFGGPVDTEETQIQLRDETGFANELVWPAGAAAFRLIVDGEEQFNTDNGSDRLFPVQRLMSGPVFSPTDVTVKLTATDGADGWSVTSEFVLGGSPVVSPDSLEFPTQSAQWFDDGFAAAVDSDDPGAGVAQLMADLRDRGGPMRHENTVLFIAPAMPGETAPEVRGTWNEFTTSEPSQLHRISPGFWARFVDMPTGQQDYKIYYPDGGDEGWAQDISNPHIRWDGLVPAFGEPGDFNSVIAPEGPRTVWMPDVESDALGNARDLYVHLPAAYDGDTGADFPVLYAQDGNESITRGQFHFKADETIAANSAANAVVVFIGLNDLNERIDDYTILLDGTRGDDYVDWMADDVVPLIDGSFRTRADRTARGIYGSSLGGLIAYWGAMQRPETFGYAAGMSSSFWWENEYIVGEIVNRGCQDIVYYVDAGSLEMMTSVGPASVAMRDALEGLGCQVTYLVDDGAGHDWAFWRERFGGMLTDFAAFHGG